MWKRTFLSGCLVLTAARTLPVPVAVNDEKVDSNSRPDFRRPGVFVWGSNANRVVAPDQPEIAFLKSPSRLSFLDGQILKDLAISESVGCAVLSNGDVVQWKDGKSTKISGRKIKSVKISGNTVVGLSSNSKVYTWPAESSEEIKPIDLKLPQMWWFESIADIEAGENHILARTSRGRVFTGSTNSPEKSKAQYGIASFSQFEKPPPSGTLYPIKLIEDIPISQIAAGDYHSLVCSKNGRLFGFGENTNGQLGISFSYRTANVGAPTQLQFGLKSQALSNPTLVTGVAAGGNVTYVTTEGPNGRIVYSMGNGQYGQLGTGSFSHSQVQPLTLKKLGDMKEYSEVTKSMRPIDILSWSIGKDHSFLVMHTSSSEVKGNNVLAWGWNDKGQLGNGKRATVSQPTQLSLSDSENFIPLQLIESEKLRYMDDKGKMKTATVSQQIVAGNKCSGIFYTKA